MSPDRKTQAPIVAQRARLQHESRIAWSANKGWSPVTSEHELDLPWLFPSGNMELIGLDNLFRDMRKNRKRVYTRLESNPSEKYIRIDFTDVDRQLMFLGTKDTLEYLPKDTTRLRGESCVRSLVFGKEKGGPGGDIAIYCGDLLNVRRNAKSGAEFIVVVSSQGELRTFGNKEPGD